jgi:3-oxoadipate enol-lactonase
VADTASDLLAVPDSPELERAHVVGLSYGGGIAQTAAITFPERSQSPALLATSTIPSRP